MSHDFQAALPDQTVFRSPNGYFYAYGKDDAIDDSKETAWFSSAANQDDPESGRTVGLHIADAVKQSKSKREQLRSQLRLLMKTLPSDAEGPKQLFDQYGFTDSELPEGALYIAQFRTDLIYGQDGFTKLSGLSLNENLPDDILASTREYLAILERYATNMFDMLDMVDPVDESSEDEAQSATIAILASFDSIAELDHAINNEADDSDVSMITAFRVTPNDDDDTLHFDAQWGDIPHEGRWIVPMCFTFYSHLMADLPDATVPDSSSYPAYACFFGNQIPDNATPIAWLLADHTVEPDALRCFIRMPEDQESFDALAVLHYALSSYISAARQVMQAKADAAGDEDA